MRMENKDKYIQQIMAESAKEKSKIVGCMNEVNKLKDMADLFDKEIANLRKKMDVEIPDIYPLTILCDRYHGTYSGGRYTAWNLWSGDISEYVDGDDVTCADYFKKCKVPYGVGNTPNEAVIDLEKKIRKGRG